MDTQSYEIPSWMPQIERGHVSDQGIIIADSEGDSGHHTDYLVHEVPSNIDQIAAENLIFMARDGQMEIIDTAGSDVVHDGGSGDVGGANDDSGIVNFHDDYAETQMVTEEVITDDWVQHQGEERVEIPAEQISGSLSQHINAQDIEVSLPTVQDEYTALRPYPCDFCSRRFRKKVSLMNHMVAHQNDRPHVCKLCGSRFFRRNDLINHLKAHAESSEFDENEFFQDERQSPPPNDHYYDQEWSNEMKSATKKSRSKRMSKGPPKEENYTIDETLRQRHLQQQQEHQNQPVEVTEFFDEAPVVGDDVKNVQRFPVIDENKPFVCQQCGLSFAREKALSSHVKSHRNDSTFECGTCNELFWDSNALQEHQKSHQFEASNSEYEPDVDNESDSESEYKYGDFYCSQCGMSFHRQDLLRRHSKSHIKKEVVDKDQHCCNTCGESFVEALDLLAHAEIHARYPPFKCVLCGESFFEESTIKRHLTNLHSAEMTSNSCILCGKECRDRKALMKHAWDHSREKCHSCSKCGKNFHNKARLKRHMASHRDKSVVCNVCQEEFPDGRSLSNHRHSHSINASGKLFPCNECGKTFGSRSSQQIHVRIHTGERPYGCRYCWKAFADGGTLRKHERIHTGEKPYACSVCPRAFNQRVVLREHIRSHHSGLDSKRQAYFCSVCCSELPSSTELIQHLIQHSDINTAMQRQPVTGPRKYKRRRKLKPHEIDRLRTENKNSSDIDISDFDMDNVDDLLGIPNATSSTSKTQRGQTPSDHNSSATTTALLGTPDTDSKKQRYNSTGSSEKYPNNWHTKLINSSTEDTYKSLLSNLENTLQSIDTLVVSNNSSSYTNNTTTAEVSPPPPQPPPPTATSLPKTSKPPRRKNASSAPKSSSSNRPKMIHTEKTRLPIENGKRKTKTFVTRTEPTDLDMFSQRSKCSSSHANDYEIISPDKYPPNQIQSSPVHIKQETVCTRSELYDAQLLLEATSARRELDKYNPAIVNDLEEILRSPDKSKSPRRRTISERTDDEIKAEPCSPIQQNFDFVRRSTRSRRPVVNRKYLAYETDLPSASPSPSKSKPKNEKRDSKPLNQSPASIKRTPPSPMPSSPATPPTPPTPPQPQPQPATRKQHYFECEMCSSVFPDRAQLLDHVPIHI